jgi:predicted neuraminidase
LFRQLVKARAERDDASARLRQVTVERDAAMATSVRVAVNVYHGLGMDDEGARKMLRRSMEAWARTPDEAARLAHGDTANAGGGGR